jgi:Cu-Zn family superoxide dismutase
MNRCLHTRKLAVTLLAATLALPALAADRASARILDRQGMEVGSATLIEGPHGVLIHVTAKGLPPGPKAIHIHSIGSCEDGAQGFVASKGHLNPATRPHGLMNPDGPDAGDLPNLFVHADGSVEAELFTPYASLKGSGGRATILDADGAALLIHENRDDHATQPIGGAGGRFFCGTIGGL